MGLKSFVNSERELWSLVMFEGTFTELGDSVLFLLLFGLLLRGLTVLRAVLTFSDEQGIPPLVPSLTSEAWTGELLYDGMFFSLLS